MKMTVDVAAAQIPQGDDPGENCERIISVIRDEPSPIICFPETALTGAGFFPPEILDEHHKAIASATLTYDKLVIYGSYVEMYGKTYNCAFVVDRGEVLHVAAKMRLWATEIGNVTPGGNSSAVCTRFGVIGVNICWEIMFPEICRNLARSGSKVIFCPAYWFKGYKTMGMVEAAPFTRAAENQVFFVFVDAASGETSERSQICSPEGVMAAATPGSNIIRATMDFGDLEMTREIFDCWRWPAR